MPLIELTAVRQAPSIEAVARWLLAHGWAELVGVSEYSRGFQRQGEAVWLPLPWSTGPQDRDYCALAMAGALTQIARIHGMAGSLAVWEDVVSEAG